MIAVVIGPDAALVREHVRGLLVKHDPDGYSTSCLDGTSASMTEVEMDIASPGFFGSGRAVVVDGLIARLGKQGSKEGGATPDWPRLFAAVPPENLLLLEDASLMSVPAAVKKALPADAQVLTGDPPRGRDLLRWIRDTAKQEFTEIDDRTATLLADTLYPQSWRQKSNNPAYDRPPNLELLRNEIAKLAVAAHPGSIEASHVQSLVDRGDEDQVFRFLDAAAAGNVRGAVMELDKLLASGEDPHRLLAQLGGNLELSALMSQASGRAPAEVGKAIKLPNTNRMNAISRGLGNQPRGLPATAMAAFGETDQRMKTGLLRDPIDALYELIAVIAAARQRLAR